MIRWPVLLTFAFIVLLVIYFRPVISGRVAKVNMSEPTDQAIVPTDQIKDVLPRDAIAAINEPKFTPVSQTDFKDDSLVLSLSIGADHRAYPLPILNWHEVVNDVVGGKKVAVTFCPLCATGLAYDRVVNGQELLFGVSGKLYKNNLVMYDRQTQSFWSQAGAKAIAGPFAGTSLTQIPISHQTLSEFKANHPDGIVLAKPIGLISRDYDTDPYEDYAQSQAIGIFDQNVADKRVPPKALIFGLAFNGKFKAYPVQLLPPTGLIEDSLGGEPMVVYQDIDSSFQAAFLAKLDGKVLTFEFQPNLALKDKQSGTVWSAESGQAIEGSLKGKQLTKLVGIQSYWFSWSDFHPETELYRK